jgi:hypothetical protein
MRDKTASPTEASQPAAKQRKPRDKGVIALKGPGGLPRTAKRPARGRKQTAAPVTSVETVATRTESPSPAEPTASELKTKRLERIKERAGVKRPAVAPGPAAPVEAPPVAMEAPPVAMEVPPVAIEVAPAEVSPVAIETPAATEVAASPSSEAQPAVIEAAPATFSLALASEQSMSPPSHHRPWSPPTARRRRTSLPVALVARVISTLLRWGGLRR